MDMQQVVGTQRRTSYFCIPVPYNEKDIFFGFTWAKMEEFEVVRSSLGTEIKESIYIEKVQKQVKESIWLATI